MIKNLLKGLLSGVASRLLDSVRRHSVQLLKIEAAKCYLRGVQMARLSAISLMRTGLQIGLVCVGVLLFHAGLFILLPWTVEVKAILIMSLGVAYTLLGGLGLRMAMDEKTWMETSGAAGMLRNALCQSKKD